MRTAAHGGRRETRSRFRALAAGVFLVCLQQPRMVTAAPAEVSTAPDPVDELDDRGREQVSRKEYLEAARTWKREADLLPVDEVDNHRDLFDRIAGAYSKATAANDGRSVLKEAVEALDKYASAFASAHPGTTLNERGISIHQMLRSRLAAQAPELMYLPPEDDLLPVTKEPVPAAKPSPPISQTKPAPPPEVKTEPLPEPATPPTARRKNLTIAGGVTVGLGAGMLGMFIGTYVRAKSLQKTHEDLECLTEQPDPRETCQDLNSRGERAGAISTAGIIAAPLLLGAGIAMLVVARRPSTRQSIVPSLSPVMVGAVWRLRF